MFKRLVAPAVSALAVAVFAFTGALAGGLTVSSDTGRAAPPAAVVAATTAAPTAPTLPCAPSLQRPQCLLSGLSCHTRCATTAPPAAPGLPCAPNLQHPLCILGGLTCHMRCAATPATSGAAVTSPPGDPCSRNWGEPINTICHL